MNSAMNPAPTGPETAGPRPPRSEPTGSRAHAGSSSRRTRVLAQTSFEARAILRNGEQLMVTVVVPVLALVGLVQADVLDVDTGGLSRIDFFTPGILALAVMTSSFTSQAIASAFDRRNGVLRLLSTTPLGRGGLLAGKVLGVLVVELVQVLVIGLTAVALGWRPDALGVALSLVAVLLGTAAFTSLAMLVAGTLRAEAVLAVANLALLLLAIAGGVIVPADRLPGPLSHLALLLPSGALGEAMRGAFQHGTLPAWSVVVLVGWTAALGWGAGRLFRWH